MASLIAGSLARTIGKALGPAVLPAMLMRGSQAYPCRGLYTKWGKSPGAGGALTTPDVEAFILAATLSIEPESGDIVAMQGSTFVVVSNKDSVQAIETDPARATWTLRGKFVGSNGALVGPEAAYAASAAALGQPYTFHRSSGSSPLVTPPTMITPVIVTSAKAAGYSYTRSSTFDDVLFALQADFTNVQVGDYLVGPGGTYFIADMPSLRPVVAVGCNGFVSVTRPGLEVSASGGVAPGLPSQPNSTGTYWGESTTPVVDPNGVGSVAVRANIPASLIGTAGRATGTGELPSDSPGPSRYRIHLPQSAFPKGTVENRDILTDDLGRRFQVSTAYWSTIGYRLEVIELEN